MAFLHPVRLTFVGNFQADVSTVNNDVRHYDNVGFAPNFQQLQTPQNDNGWWNPTGSGAFRFIDCRVTSVSYADGSTTTDPAVEPLIGATVLGAPDRTAGKLVDIDPQWQLASAPWGLGVRLVAGNQEVFRGDYLPHAFRDLWFGRAKAKGDSGASSTFQSVVDDIEWADEQPDSRLLTELRAATAAGRLSIRLTTFGFDGTSTSPTFTLGTMIGTIGPALDDEPESFILGRRFAPVSGFTSFGANITYFPGLVEEAGRTLLLDLSNALQIIDPAGTPADIGRLTVGVLLDETIAENTPVTDSTFLPLGDIPYTEPGWLQRTGGVWSVRLSPDQAARAAEHPLALVYQAPFNPSVTGEDTGTLGVVAIRETVDGLLVGAEPIVLRIDAHGHEDVTFWSARYGTPTDRTLQLRQLGSIPGQGGGRPGPHIDSIPIPDIGVPTEALTVPENAATAPGGVTVRLQAGEPGNPRGYIDGQIYCIDYRIPGQGNNARQPFDFVVAHVRDAYPVPEQPTWEDAKAVLQQYSNLYPIMSHGFIDLADEDDVWANRDLLILSFEAGMDDPNHMPVTRDLSAPKRDMLLGYLRGDRRLGAAAATPGEQERVVVGHRPPGPVPEPPDPAYTPPADSKSRFAANLLGGGRAAHGATTGGE